MQIEKCKISQRVNLTFAFCNLHPVKSCKAGILPKAKLFHRVNFAMERSDRSLYWLKLVERTGLISGNELKALVDEANELTKIVAKSVITAKGKGK